MPQSLTPKLFTVLQSYSREQFFKDLTAGILVGIIAFSLAIALAVSSGVNPEVGINTAIVAGFLISFLGGSRVQIGGPTAAFIPIVFNTVIQYGIEGLIISTIMAGLLLIVMGCLKLGVVIKFIPYPVVTGFTTGIAVSILVKQIKELLGLSFQIESPNFIELINVYVQHIDTLHIPTFSIGLLALFIMIFFAKYPCRFTKYLPPSLIAIIITSYIVYYFDITTIATVGSVYKNININLFNFNMPSNFNIAMLKQLMEPAFSIAILAGIESLLSAVIADGMIGGHHRANAELVAQGTANIFSGLMGGMPATGAIARTATNVANGGRTPIAGIIHAITVLLIMLAFMPLVRMIPLATLAAVLMNVAYNMGEWQLFRDLGNAPKSDALVYLTTLGLTVIIDLTIAIKVGLILAAFLFIKRMADVTEINQLIDFDEGDVLSENPMRENISKQFGEQALLYEIRGPFFFGAVDKLVDTINKINMQTKLIIVKMQEVPTVDSTGMHALRTFYKTCKNNNIVLYFTHLHAKPLQILQKNGFINLLGAEHFCKNISTAIKHYKEHYSQG